jgi:hypothetical protein
MWTDGQTDRQTDRYDECNSIFSQFLRNRVEIGEIVRTENYAKHILVSSP